MQRVWRRVVGVGERPALARGAASVEDGAVDGMRLVVAGHAREVQRAREVLAQVRTRRREENRSARLSRGDGGSDGGGRSAGHHHVDVLHHGQLASHRAHDHARTREHPEKLLIHDDIPMIHVRYYTLSSPFQSNMISSFRFMRTSLNERDILASKVANRGNRTAKAESCCRFPIRCRHLRQTNLACP